MATEVSRKQVGPNNDFLITYDDGTQKIEKGGPMVAGQGTPTGDVVGAVGNAFDKLGSAAGLQGGSAKAPVYGTTRSGGAPDPNNFYLGGDAGYAGQLASQWQNAGGSAQMDQRTQAGMMNNAGEAARATQQNLGNAAWGYGDAAGRRGMTNADYGGAQGDIGAQRNAAGQLAGYAGQLQSMAAAPEGPSAAQAQLQQGTNQALNSQLALMRSGGTAGSSAAAGDSARFNSAGLQANQANSSAALRAQENAAYRDRQLNAMGLAGQTMGVSGNMSADLANRGTQMAQFDEGNRQQQRQQNDQTALAGMGLAGQSYASGYGQQLQGLAGGSDALGKGWDSYNQGMQGGLATQQTGLQGTMGLEGLRGDLYGAELGHQTDMRGLDQQKSKDTWGTIGGVAESIGGMFMMSDRRSKKNVKEESFLETYKALGA